MDELTLRQRNAKLQIDIDRAALQSQESQLQADTDEAGRLRPTIDTSDQAAVDQFNELVDRVNTGLAAIQITKTRFNEEVDQYNANQDALDRLYARPDAIAKSINGR